MSPELDPVLPGEFIFDTWGNDVARRSAQRYQDQADLATKQPTPQSGELAYLIDEGLLYLFNGVSWLLVGKGVFLSLDGSDAMTGQVLAIGGSAGAPGISFAASPDMGMYRANSGQMFLAVGAVGSLLLTSTQIRALSGTALSPSISFIGDQNSGLYSPASTQVALSAGSNEVFRGSTLRNYLLPGYDDTSGTAANMVYISSDGRVGRSTSARKYKSDIQPSPQLADLDLAPVTFHHDGDDNDYIGFIADDMPIEEAIIRDEDGDVENYDVRAVVAILAAKINRLEAQLNG